MVTVKEAVIVRRATMAGNVHDKTTYTVVVNHEEQYSIWPADRDLPEGWQQVGVTGTKAECLDHIEEVWTDIRPLSLRKRISQASQETPGSDQSGDSQ
jgi:MbtH protein